MNIKELLKEIEEKVGKESLSYDILYKTTEEESVGDSSSWLSQLTLEQIDRFLKDFLSKQSQNDNSLSESGKDTFSFKDPLVMFLFYGFDSDVIDDLDIEERTLLLSSFVQRLILEKYQRKELIKKDERLLLRAENKTLEEECSAYSSMTLLTQLEGNILRLYKKYNMDVSNT